MTDVSFDKTMAARLHAASQTLARRWLERLNDLLSVDRQDIFPTTDLLDHIPQLIQQIASFVAAPEIEELAANTGVVAKARELGRLRHAQRASVHQLLREYHLLGGILEAFVGEETQRLRLTPPALEVLRVASRISHALRVLQQTTIDAFIAEYTDRIVAQHSRLESFNRGVAIRVADDLPVIAVDVARLELVLMNLVSNAIKYSDPAKPERFVEIFRSGASEDGHTLCVRDNGVGVPAGDIEHIFENFFRAAPERDAQLGIKGAGLGLAIVAECVAAIGGRIAGAPGAGEGHAFDPLVPSRAAPRMEPSV